MPQRGTTARLQDGMGIAAARLRVEISAYVTKVMA